MAIFMTSCSTGPKKVSAPVAIVEPGYEFTLKHYPAFIKLWLRLEAHMTPEEISTWRERHVIALGHWKNIINHSSTGDISLTDILIGAVPIIQTGLEILIVK